MMDYTKIVDMCENIDIKDVSVVEGNIAKEVLVLAEEVYAQGREKGLHPWFRGVDMIERLKHLGKPNVRNHLERLVDKGKLESGLHNNKKVYRLKVIEDD